mmetsp:Transcript_14009/g.21799  ORF Transcript_14009/g.21799 Transcript_14009/m.21799 type:complete len:108 (-) Transcript_14009:117-440(-)|eukprot:CAMPEP_0184323272 /NCGR_PEP_ID=MMETSP1049-20130417/129481_1 /TAXON_ID=77928 /ORGANISM="Proteomonas sulcata, Strain CCMP704" /LENGTH=107 /DNA_ID=CAMNT_0026644729 /DNA_START=78 /DNA_END=401 /DNA_ORIENTATION=+
MAQRVAGAMNRAAGLSFYTARTLQEYVEMAIRLARRPKAAEELRHRLMRDRASSRLFNSQAMVASLESGYRMAREVLESTGRHMHLITHGLVVGETLDSHHADHVQL